MVLAQISLSIGDVTDIVQTIAVVVSLIYVAIQVREGTRAAKGATYQSIITAFAEIESRISQDAEVAGLYGSGQANIDNLNETEKARFNELMYSLFNLYENLHYQYNNKLLEEELWAGWCQNMRDHLAQPGVAAWWKSKNYLYAKSFCKYVNSGKCPRD
ncbi:MULTISPECIES: hypothetical protein [Cyanophyceae]|uniref:hypothetical protein n=1 Tax=Cyanophyceae TaxID=3028117 RepID=UPI00168636A7|nr:hypothetical protein [Trichocoleus sp. FACHB-69]MBD1930427.1 hypothetical protein [Trichocoleus sp. FACHB-69]